MNFGSIIGAKISHWLESDSFFKSYENIDDYHWNRIKNASIILSNEKIGPFVKSIDDTFHLIEYQEVAPFNIYEPAAIPNIKTKIESLVSKMHALGYGHGDLHIQNLGHINDGDVPRLVILDHDSMYKIDEPPSPSGWVTQLMQEGHEWDGTFEDFVKNDYDTWRTDWLY